MIAIAKIALRFVFRNSSLILVVASIVAVAALSCSDADRQDAAVQNDIHPRILVTSDAKQEFTNSLDQVKWKAQLVEEKKERLEKYMALCDQEPDWLRSRLQMNWKTRHNKIYLIGGKFSHSDGEAPVPTVRYSGSRDWATDYKTPELEQLEPFADDPRGLYLQHKDTDEWEWVKPPDTGHIIEGINNRIMRLVADAAFLYWFTGDERYAAFAKPIFFTYTEGMHYLDPPEVIDNSHQSGLSGLATFEVIHESIVISLALTYDFLFDYFGSQQMDLDYSQEVFQKWGDQIIKNGVPNNNWNLFQARFLTYIALVLEDDEAYDNGKGQQYYLKYTFDESTERQIALKESLLVYDQQNGIWPESPSYSMHVATTLLEIITLLDHHTNADELANYPIIEKAVLASFQYLFPSGYTVGFGDSNHRTIPPKNLELLTAYYQKYQQSDKALTMSGLLNELIENGSYQRGGRGLFEMFFYSHTLPTGKSDYKQDLITPTFYAPNVSLFIQRIGEGEQAMMTSTVGSYGNHAHANGIAIELFANRFVLGPDMGRGVSYWHPEHVEFYSQMPAHNTVIVDGISSYRSMRSYNPFTLIHCFPESGQTPKFNKVTFSNVSFLEPKTRSDQQRLTAQILTNSGQPYALDIFRSRKVKDTLQRHEYVYHNLGQKLEIVDSGNRPVSLTATNDLGSGKELKGYRYFKNQRKATIAEDFSARFTLNSHENHDNTMRLWFKGQREQQVYSVLGPGSRALSKGTAPTEMIDSPIPAVVVRRHGPAWTKPFVVVFNPYTDDQNSIASVDFNDTDYGSQLVTITMEDGSYDKVVVGESANAITEDENLQQHGLLSVRRTSADGKMEFIMVSAMNRFIYQGWEIISEGEPATVSIEREGTNLVIENDQPVLLRMSSKANPGLMEMNAYEDGVVVSSRKGKVSRFNSDQIEFRLPQAYDKVVITGGGI